MLKSERDARVPGKASVSLMMESRCNGVLPLSDTALIGSCRTLLRGLTSAQLIGRTSWGEPAGANSDIKMIFKTTLRSIKHSCRTNSRKRFRGVVCLESGGQHSQVDWTIRTYTKSVECAAKNWIRKNGSNKVPQVGASNVVREVVNLIGASEPSASLSTEATKSRTRTRRYR